MGHSVIQFPILGNQLPVSVCFWELPLTSMSNPIVRSSFGFLSSFSYAAGRLTDQISFLSMGLYMQILLSLNVFFIFLIIKTVPGPFPVFFFFWVSFLSFQTLASGGIWPLSHSPVLLEVFPVKRQELLFYCCQYVAQDGVLCWSGKKRQSAVFLRKKNTFCLVLMYCTWISRITKTLNNSIWIWNLHLLRTIRLTIWTCFFF